MKKKSYFSNVFLMLMLVIFICDANFVYANESSDTFLSDIQTIFDEVRVSYPNVKYDEFGISILDINSGNYWGVNDNLTTDTDNLGTYAKFMAASVIKLPVCYAIFKMAQEGELDLYEYYTDPVSGYRFRLKDRIIDALKYSRNIALNNLIRTFSTTKINNKLSELGFTHIKIFSEIGPGDPDKSYENNIARYGNSLGGRINSHEVAMVLYGLYQDYQAGAAGAEILFNALKENVYSDRIPKGINYRYNVAHKTGTIGYPDGVYNDCGLIVLEDKPFILCFVNQHQKEASAEGFEHEFSKRITDYMKSVNLEKPRPEIQYEEYAQKLSEIGIFQGNSNGFELEKTSTRLEAAVMFVRLLGKEQEALEENYEHPFRDVDWGSEYVGYLYHYQFTKGISESAFGSDLNLTAKDYATYMLRALGYNDCLGDFNYDDALQELKNKGIIDQTYYEVLLRKEFIRDDIVYISYNVLNIEVKNTAKPLREYLALEN